MSELSCRDAAQEFVFQRELPQRRAYVYRFSPGRATRTRFGIMWDAVTEEEAILAAVVDLVLEASEKLRACLGCGKVFVTNHRQRYCSAEHSQEMRDYRKKTRTP